MKSLNNILNIGYKLTEKNTHSSLSDDGFWSGQIANSYFDGWMEIHVHIEGAIGQYCAIFRKASVNIEVVNPQQISGIHPQSRNIACCEVQVPVLVNGGEGVKNLHPEPIQVRSVIGLQALNNCVALWPDPINPFPEALLGWIDKDWKFRLLTGSGGVVRSNEAADKVVKCTSQIVENVTTNSADIERWSGECAFKAPDLAAWLALQIDGNTIWMSIKENLYSIVQSLVVFPSASYFGSRPIEWLHMLQYPYGEESGKEAKDTKGTRDSRTNTGGVRAQSEEGSQTQEVTASESEGVESRTSPDHHSDEYIAKHTRLGSLEDV